MKSKVEPKCELAEELEKLNKDDFLDIYKIMKKVSDEGTTNEIIQESTQKTNQTKTKREEGN